MRRNHSRKAGILLLLGLSAVLLGGCETTGPANPITELAAYRVRAQQADAQQPAEKPVSRAQIAMDCWALAEKSHGHASIDARGDFVTACIDAKMKGSDVKSRPATARASKPKPEAKPDAKPEAAPDSKPKT